MSVCIPVKRAFLKSGPLCHIRSRHPVYIWGTSADKKIPEKEIPENQICPDDHGDRHKTAGRSFDRAFVCQGFFSLSYPGTSGH